MPRVGPSDVARAIEKMFGVDALPPVQDKLDLGGSGVAWSHRDVWVTAACSRDKGHDGGRMVAFKHGIAAEHEP
jgi:hypothetical protein